MRLQFLILRSGFMVIGRASGTPGSLFVLEDAASVTYATIPTPTPVGGVSMASLLNVQLLGLDQFNVPADAVLAHGHVDADETDGFRAPSPLVRAYVEMLRQHRSRTVVKA